MLPRVMVMTGGPTVTSIAMIHLRRAPNFGSANDSYIRAALTALPGRMHDSARVSQNRFLMRGEASQFVTSFSRGTDHRVGHECA